MAAPALLPPTLHVRLCIIEAYTGTPETTLRAAISKGDIEGKKKCGAWYITLEQYESWIEDGDDAEEKAKGGGDLRAASVGDVELLRPQGEQEGKGGARKGQAGGVSKPAKASRAREKRCAPGKRVITYDLGAELA